MHGVAVILGIALVCEVTVILVYIRTKCFNIQLINLHSFSVMYS